MKMEEDLKLPQLISDLLEKDSVGILPADTLYGIVCSAYSSKAIEKIYHIKKRSKDKPFAVIFNSIERAEDFFNFSDFQREFIMKHKKLGFSFIVNNFSAKLTHLEKNGKICIRILENEIFDNINIPIVATSCNVSGDSDVFEFSEIKDKIKSNVDFFVDKDEFIIHKKHSTIVDISSDEVVTLRS